MRRTPAISIIAVLALALGVYFIPSGNSQRLKPIELEPSYQHAKYAPLPQGTDIIAEFRAYTTCFDSADDDNGDGTPDKLGIPHWVAYEMRAQPEGLGTAPKRPSKWISDETLHADGVAPDDDSYKGSGFSRGHMCMKSHAWRLGEDADWNTHTVLNACPQDQRMNNGAWRGLEEKTGQWADSFGTVWIICGPILYNHTPSAWIGDSGEVPAAIPDAFFKIVLRESEDNALPEVLAFIFPMYGDQDYGKRRINFSPYLTSVDIIEALTGLNFLPNLTDSETANSEANQLEQIIHTALWEGQ